MPTANYITRCDLMPSDLISRVKCFKFFLSWFSFKIDSYDKASVNFKRSKRKLENTSESMNILHKSHDNFRYSTNYMWQRRISYLVNAKKETVDKNTKVNIITDVNFLFLLFFSFVRVFVRLRFVSFYNRQSTFVYLPLVMIMAYSSQVTTVCCIRCEWFIWNMWNRNWIHSRFWLYVIGYNVHQKRRFVTHSIHHTHTHIHTQQAVGMWRGKAPTEMNSTSIVIHCYMYIPRMTLTEVHMYASKAWTENGA